MTEVSTDEYLYVDEFTLRTFERVGLIRKTGDSDGEPVYLRTEFDIKFMDAHRNDSEEEFEDAIERLKRAH
jgi:hypothetical protein